MTPQTTLAPGAPWPIWPGTQVIKQTRAVYRPTRAETDSRRALAQSLLKREAMPLVRIAKALGSTESGASKLMLRLIEQGKVVRFKPADNCRSQDPYFYEWREQA